MEFNIESITELEKGNAELIINMDDETLKYLINYAIIDIIKQGLYNVKELHD
jgi:hypothetical protein